jgi:hypothetical protein
MDGGCYTIHLQRTLAGAEPWHDEGVETLRPQPGHRLVVRSDSRRGSNITRRQRSTDASQLRAFTGARREDVRTGPDDAVANMSVSRHATQRLGNRGENLTAAALPCCATAADESRGNDWSSVGPQRPITSPPSGPSQICRLTAGCRPRTRTPLPARRGLGR